MKEIEYLICAEDLFVGPTIIDLANRKLEEKNIWYQSTAEIKAEATPYVFFDYKNS